MPARKRWIARFAFLTFAGLIWTYSLAARTGAEEVFRGEIADSQCAMNVHSLTRSHKEMLKSRRMGKTARDCSIACVRRSGGVYVLQHGDTVYKLDDQTQGEHFAGEKVEVKGVLDAETNTIHVISIEAATK